MFLNEGKSLPDFTFASQCQLALSSFLGFGECMVAEFNVLYFLCSPQRP